MRAAACGSLPHLHQKTITFEAYCLGAGTVRISDGNMRPNMSSCVEVTPGSLRVRHFSPGAVSDGSSDLGWTLSGHFRITVRQYADKTADITVNNEGRQFTVSRVFWQGRGETVSAEWTDGAFTDAGLVISCPDYRAETWAFGDSYFDYWVPEAVALGAENVLWDGCSGRASLRALDSLEEDLKHGLPKRILWCMGMNDPDDKTAVSKEWKTAYDAVREICDERQIEFIPVTIPNVPSRNHRLKNQIIRESGCRYVDLSRALGADTSEGWNRGLIGSDRLHPSEAGQAAIAKAVLNVLPELTGGNNPGDAGGNRPEAAGENGAEVTGEDISEAVEKNRSNRREAGGEALTEKRQGEK